MSGYSDSVLERKLVDLNNSPQSIQQLSVWLIHHRKHYQSIVKCWFKELGKAKPNSRKLTFLYLANDVSQNSKKKHPEYSKEFGSVMKQVLEHLAVIDLEEKTIKSIERLLKIWQDRAIFDSKIQADLSKIWTTKILEAAIADDGVKTPPQPPNKKIKTGKRLFCFKQCRYNIKYYFLILSNNILIHYAIIQTPTIEVLKSETVPVTKYPLSMILIKMKSHL